MILPPRVSLTFEGFLMIVFAHFFCCICCHEKHQYIENLFYLYHEYFVLRVNSSFYERLTDFTSYFEKYMFCTFFTLNVCLSQIFIVTLKIQRIFAYFYTENM